MHYTKSQLNTLIIIMSVVRVLYHISDGMTVTSSIFMSLVLVTWLVYFICELYSNYVCYKNLKLRYNDYDVILRLNRVKKMIMKDFLFIIVLISEVIVPILFIVDILNPTFVPYINDLTTEVIEENYNCTRIVHGTNVLFYSHFGSLELIFRSFTIGMWIIQIKLYNIVINFFIAEYTQHSLFNRQFYLSLLATCIQFVVVIVLSSVFVTFPIGITVSVIFIVYSIYSFAISSRKLYLILKSYLQDIKLIHNTDAKQEYKRVYRMTRKFTISSVIFAVLFSILTFGFTVCLIGSVWVESLFLFNCPKVNPYSLQYHIHDTTQDILVDVSVFSRGIQSFCAAIYYTGIGFVSIAIGWSSLYGRWRNRNFHVDNRLTTALLI